MSGPAAKWPGPERPTVLYPADRNLLLQWLVEIEACVERGEREEAVKGLARIRGILAPKAKGDAS